MKLINFTVNASTLWDKNSFKKDNKELRNDSIFFFHYLNKKIYV